MSRKGARLVTVLLIEDVPELGRTGEILQVSPGFARNYLLPHRLATRPTSDSQRMVEALKARKMVAEERKAQAMKELAERIPTTNITLEMKVSSDGRLYGSVNAQMISEAMKQAGLEVPPQHVRLEEPIKEIGQFQIPIHVYEDVVVEARIWVVSTAE